MNVDGSVGHDNPRAVRRFNNLGSGANKPRTRREVLEDVELTGRHLDGRSLHANLKAVFVDFDQGVDRRWTGVHINTTAQGVANPRNKHLAAEGLDDVVDRAKFKSGDDVGVFAAGGQHDDWDVPRALFPLQPLAHFKTIDTGKHEVEQDEVGRIGVCVLEGRFACLDKCCSVAGLLKIEPDECADFGFVFDNEDVLQGRHGGSHGVEDVPTRRAGPQETESSSGWCMVGIGMTEVVRGHSAGWRVVLDSLPSPAARQRAKAEVGFEPTNAGFAIRSLSPLGHSAEVGKDTHPVGPRQSPAEAPSGSLARMYGPAILLGLLIATPPPAPVVPDGAILTRVEGIMVRPEPGDPWNLRLVGGAADPEGRVRDFILMPSRVLEEMEQAQNTAGGPPTFTVTGTVALFDGRNWLMPQHVETQTAHTQRDEPTIEPADPNEPEDGMRSGGSAGDSIADIVADLQSTITTLPRSLDDGQPLTVHTEATPDGTLILSRRGRLLRGRHGAWIFVFDADAWGEGDAPVVLLPSPTLNALIAQGKRGDYREPIHVSGSLSHYRGRRFLVPTAISGLRERPNLSR